MVIIIHYREERDEEGLIHIYSEEESVCPVCAGMLYSIGSRNRGQIISSGIREILVIRRLRCLTCRKIHHELPDRIIPYKRHCTETIENIIKDETWDVCCDQVTEWRIRRWWMAIASYFKSALPSLQIKYDIAFSAEPTPREIVRAIANANLWVHTRSALSPT